MSAHCTPSFGGRDDLWMSAPVKRRDAHSSWSFIRNDAQVMGRPVASPGPTYSKRSAKLHQLRSDARAIALSDVEGGVAVTAAALGVAEALINLLWEGCLDFRLAVSHDGEINFLYGDADEFFHIHIDEDGALSYYSLVAGDEQMGSNLTPSQFPQKALFGFVERNK